MSAPRDDKAAQIIGKIVGDLEERGGILCHYKFYSFGMNTNTGERITAYKCTECGGIFTAGSHRDYTVSDVLNHLFNGGRK